MRKALSTSSGRAGLAIFTIFILLTEFASACQPPAKPTESVAPPPQVEPVKPETPLPTLSSTPTAEPSQPPAQTQPAQPAQPAAAQPKIMASSAEAKFPSQLIFRIQAAGNVNITDIRLHYTVDMERFARVTSESYVDFTPGTTIDTQWVWDMRKTGGLPTGATIEYWWTVKDDAGNKAETAPAKINFDDNRYTWQSLTENKVTLYWYRGSQAFAQELMAAAQQAMVRLSETTGAALKNPVKLYIYANSEDLQGAMIFPQEWTGGVAFTEFGIITLGIDTNNLDWGKRSIAHELTHLVVHQMTFNPYIQLPTWLNEGLSMYNEGQLEANFVSYLKLAVANNILISARSLSSPFSANSNQSYLSYAESYSLVEYLVTTYGQSKMLELLNTFSRGSSYDGALKKVYGFDMDGLNTLWRDYANKKYGKGGQTTALPSSIRTGSWGI